MAVWATWRSSYVCIQWSCMSPLTSPGSPYGALTSVGYVVSTDRLPLRGILEFFVANTYQNRSVDTSRFITGLQQLNRDLMHSKTPDYKYQIFVFRGPVFVYLWQTKRSKYSPSSCLNVALFTRALSWILFWLLYWLACFPCLQGSTKSDDPEDR